MPEALDGRTQHPVPPGAEERVRLGLDLEELGEKLGIRRHEAGRELRRALGSSGMAGLLFGLEAWGTWRGEPVFGWFLFFLFTGFALYFWARRRRALEDVAALAALVEELEGRWSRGDPPRRELPPDAGSGGESRGIPYPL